ncbi:hypothetical protein [Okeania sp. KiyG1]|uniref:hypothetical protein n=1 Tax=Okeania sp. KiyG1 TaxID=2720165 RepID=UPI00192416B0|nr:hypothetical protein [Okeania sp. KiyG1]GGA54396.1 hypothetical protein CYANOKiyG1_74700 [Okeania sp. KiyG1]
MEHLSNLLNKKDSDLSWVLRLSLRGMAAQLKEAIAKYTTDSGVQECQALLKELDSLLKPTPINEEKIQETKFDNVLIPITPPSENEESSPGKTPLEPIQNQEKQETNSSETNDLLLPISPNHGLEPIPSPPENEQKLIPLQEVLLADNKIKDSDLGWVLRLSLRGMAAQLKEAIAKYATAPGVQECQTLLEEIDLLLEPSLEPIPSPPENELKLIHLWKLLLTDNKIKDSDLGWVMRLSLRGMAAQLKEAIAKYTTAPGVQECQTLLEKLDSLLELSEANNGLIPIPPKEPLSPIPPPPENEMKIRLRVVFLTDNKLSEYVGSVELNSNNVSDLWQELQCLLLRLPGVETNRLQNQALELALKVGGEKEERSLIPLPSTKDEILYPGLTGKLKAQGLCLSTQEKLDPRLTQKNLPEELLFLAKVISLYLKFIELDPQIHHALKAVDRFGVRCLSSDSEQKSKYINALIDRFQWAVTTEESGDILKILEARIDLDEAIHSLVYVPPVPRDSWWGKLQKECRDTLAVISTRAQNAGYQVRIRPLWGSYADIFSYSQNKNNDLERDSGGTPGEVLACLRVYAKIQEEVLPGRVLFRGQR